MIHWHADLSVVVGLLVLVGGYLLAIGPLRPLFPQATRLPRGQVLSVLLGGLVIYLALQSPLHDLSDTYLFSAHMVQHEVLLLVVPPLLLLGLPAWLLRPALRVPGIAWLARAVTGPLSAFVLYNVIFGVWHYPPLYDFAMRNHGIHIGEHVMFLAAGVIMWWPVLSPLPELPRLSHLGQAAYFVAQMAACSTIGGLITLSSEILYPWYSEAPRLWDISPLADQQIGGVIMWAGGNAFFMIAAVVAFFLWAGQHEAEARRSEGLGDMIDAG